MKFVFEGESEMAARFRSMDWSKTPLGTAETWPQSLKTAVDIMLKSEFPMFIAWGPKRIFLYNDAYSKILGNKNQTALGQEFETIWKEIWPDLLPLIESVDQGKAVYLEDMRLLIHRHGFEEETYFTFSYSPIRDDSGNIGGLYCVVVETTGRKRAEQKFLVEREKLEALFYGTNFPMVLFRGPDLVFEMANKKYLELIGFRDVIGKQLLEALPEIASSDYPQLIKNVYESGIPARSLERHTPLLNPKTGLLEDRYFDTTFSRIVDVPGMPYLVIGNAMDVTERVVARKLLENAKKQTDLEAIRADRERAKFEAAFHAVAEGIFIFDSNGNPVFMNDGAAKVFGAKSAAEVTQGFEYYFERLDLYDLNDNFIPLTEWPVVRVLRGESFRDWQIKAHRRDTDEKWIWSSSGELAKQKGSDVSLAVVVLRDITDQVKSEIELKQAKSEAEHANVLKSAFLANMSHEIRTPLGAMLGFADLLRDPAITEKDRNNFLDILTRNGNQLSYIINDILDLSKVEAGHLTLEFTQCSPHLLIEDILSLLRVKAQEKNLELSYERDPSTPQQIVTDPTRFRQVLINLVSNAIKFTKVGSVTVKTHGHIIEDGASLLSVEISDTGIGLTPDQHEKIFEAFVQADGSMTRRFGGTGLGLALSRQLSRALDGDISVVRSQPNVGTTFLFEVKDQPQKLETKPAPRKEAKIETQEVGLSGVRILVVDDSPDNQHLLSLLLSKKGAIVELADNGLLGYRKALTGDYDLILMDIQMPEMDGYTATHKLRIAGFQKPIIALTAHAMGEIREKCMNVGCSGLLTKPINPTELVQTIARYIQKRPKPTEAQL